MNKVLLLIFLNFSSLFCFAQQNDKKGELSILAINKEFVSANFHFYNPPLQIKKTYKDTTQAKNEYPEELMISILSADNQKWNEYNFLNKKAPEKSGKHYANVKKMDINKNYFTLHSKFTFNLNNVPTSIIKFYVKVLDNPKPTSGFILMQKINNRWFATSIPGFENLAIVIMRFDSEKLQKIFVGEQTGNIMIDSVIEKTRNETGGLDFDKLNNVYVDWYKNNEQKFIDYFIDKNAW